jgi:hypothetical protein
MSRFPMTSFSYDKFDLLVCIDNFTNFFMKSTLDRVF